MLKKTCRRSSDMIRFCDLCGKRGNNTCWICRRDCCYACAKFIDSEALAERDYFNLILQETICTDCRKSQTARAIEKLVHAADENLKTIVVAWQEKAAKRLGNKKEAVKSDKPV